MPCDYSKYPANWKKEIRPAILERDGHACQRCKVPNGEIICRGKWNGREVWQNDDGHIHDAETGEYLGDTYVGDVWASIPLSKHRLTKVVLTIAHLDQNPDNNELENLAALCQRCHLYHDRDQHKANARETNRRKKGLQNLF